MKPTTLEWVNKAEDDFIVTQRESRARKNPIFDAICFHAQQCAEKYLKARLEEAGLPIPKTHNLPALLTLVLPLEPSWSVLNIDLGVLTNYSVSHRYPGITATKTDAQDALKRIRSVRRIIRQSFGFSV